MLGMFLYISMYTLATYVVHVFIYDLFIADS